VHRAELVYFNQSAVLAHTFNPQYGRNAGVVSFQWLGSLFRYDMQEAILILLMDNLESSPAYPTQDFGVTIGAVTLTRHEEVEFPGHLYLGEHGVPYILKSNDDIV
jgi:hypothetical protein